MKFKLLHYGIWVLFHCCMFYTSVTKSFDFGHPRVLIVSTKRFAIMRRRQNNASSSLPSPDPARRDPSESMQVSSSTLNSIPSHTRGIYFGGFNEPLFEKTTTIQRPSSSSQVLVQVHSVGINPVDAKFVIGDKLPYHWSRTRRWAHNAMVKDTRIGFDFAGIVAVDNPKFPKGTRVFGTMPPLKGSCAEYICAPLHQVAKTPDKLSLEECAALPLVGLTAWQALSPNVRKDQSKVLILGASGGTGHVAVQVARALGATEVVGVCSTRNVEFVRDDCGATQIIDYTASTDILQDLVPHGPFDLVLDCVTSADPNDAQHDYPGRIRSHPSLLTPNHLYQRLGGQCSDWIRATMARPKLFPHSWIWKDARERLFWIRFPKSSGELKKLADIADDGKLRPKIQKTLTALTTDTVQQAFDDLLSRRVQGKLVIKVADSSG